MRTKTPAWTGMIFAILTIIGVGVPYVEANGELFSLFQTLSLAGSEPRAWALITACFLCVLAALGGDWRFFLITGGYAACYMGAVVGAIWYVIGLKPMLRHLRPGAWFCLVGAVGLLLSPVFRPVDRVLHRELLAFWKEVGYLPDPWDGV